MKTLKNIVKYSKGIYAVYFYLGSFFLSIIGIMLKKNKKRIMFVSFGGQGYSDSPKSIYDAMKKDRYYDKYKLVWAFKNPGRIPEIDDSEKVKIDTLKFFVLAIKSGIWITNSSVERGLSFKSSKNFCINTWHGTPLKKMGSDAPAENESFKGKSSVAADMFLTQSQYEQDIFSRVFEIPDKQMRMLGLPRNDDLVNNKFSIEKIKSLKEKLRIPFDKKIILYAPTFREYNMDNTKKVVFKNKINFNDWSEQLGDEYVVLLRTHYEVSKIKDEKLIFNDFVYDVSNYPLLNDLMKISDMLVSDYSSIFFDYSLLGKPMFTYTYDYDMYTKKRGLYFDIRKAISGGNSEKKLLNEIKNINWAVKVDESVNFRDNYINNYGKATEKIIKEIECLNI